MMSMIKFEEEEDNLRKRIMVLLASMRVLVLVMKR